MKTCKTCGVEQPISAYYNDGTYTRSSCRTCRAAYNKAHALKHEVHRKQTNAVWRSENPESLRKTRLRKNFGMTTDEYDLTLRMQGGRCACCGTDIPGGKGAFQVDHCHESLQIRSLLCVGCNGGTGIKDEPDKLAKKIIYLLNHGARLSGELLAVINKKVSL